MRYPASALAGVLLLGLMLTGAEGAHKLRVVTTIPDLKALVEEVGGDLVDVESLARGTQNAHEVEVRPSLMIRLRRADLFFENGLELDAWSDVAVQGANNPKIVRGAPGRVDVSRGVQVLEMPTARVDRSMGDVHPLGNPHYSLDPGQAPIVTQNIVDGLVRVAPELRATFEKNREAFLARLEEAFGVAGVIATRARIVDGRYTGELEFYCYGDAKGDAVRAVARSSSTTATWSSFSRVFSLAEVGGSSVSMNRSRM